MYKAVQNRNSKCCKENPINTVYYHIMVALPSSPVNRYCPGILEFVMEDIGEMAMVIGVCREVLEYS